jgi:hypothetical protein
MLLQYGGAASWQSRKQRTVVLSSVEAEYMADTQATIWWRRFLTELGLAPLGPTVIYSDSQGSIAPAKNPEHHHERTKHIDIQHHFFHEQLAAGAITLPYIQTEEMVADVLTEALASNRHHRLISIMGVNNVRILCSTVHLRSGLSSSSGSVDKVSVCFMRRTMRRTLTARVITLVGDKGVTVGV